jgi:formylglycine-generating enzyme
VPKGGSWFAATGSDWYVDGGPMAPDWSVRLLLTGAGTSRSECIGFRCAVDLDDSRRP